jgi:hypothetical protein
MEEEKLGAIASESEDTRHQRAALKQKLDDLKYGKRILHVHACDNRSSMCPTCSSEKVTMKADVLKGPKTPLRSQKRTSRARRTDLMSPQTRTPSPKEQDGELPPTSSAHSFHRQQALITLVVNDIASSFNQLTVSPPSTKTARNPSVTPTQSTKDAARRRRVWPSKVATVESESDEPMFSPVQSRGMFSEVYT